MSSRRHVLVSGSFLVILMGVIGLLMTDAHARSGAVVLSTGLQKTIGTAFVSHVASSWDMESDDSFQRFLDTEHPFDPIAYVPVDLAPINSNFTANNAKKFTLRQEAGDMFADMAWHFWHTFSGDRLAIISAYRSKGYQDSLLRNGCHKDLCAKGGTSEHQAGLALDLRVVTKGGRGVTLDTPNKYTDWLHAHAQEWGFHNTYQKGLAIDGKVVEGWHWRYMQIDLATLLWQNKQTIAEYYKTKDNR